MPESLATSPRSVGAPPAPPARPRWPLLLFRVLVTGEAVLAAGQAVLAGSFLSGHYGALDLHALNATATGLTAVAQTVAAVLLWRPGGGPAWPAVTSALLFGAEAGQIAMGYGRVLAVHVPLGVALIACTLLMLVRAWRPVAAASGGAVRAEGVQGTEGAAAAEGAV
ncbi:hypothetical protein RKE30_11750 [Streptomyces sp. Li-HN-5-11]|uniref:hypothetical protein n=1 Tax=Streptomyces sp. Li-HN-5-11 TaxID=3075432 RepID=UPI0028AEE911|nr:hypothetical protein [Streptomyces sp. Li-HN-5-11]WNM31037.1 hypothetical protein RKE30_11750 [Streptomyces sp. Li-HN-5-11]